MVFSHKTDFPCLKQPKGSLTDAFYALHHMREFIRDQQRLMLPDSLLKWRKDLANVDDADIRAQFYRIQQRIAVVITEDVIKKGGCSSTAFEYQATKKLKPA
jgi:hypothetical protein